MLLSGNAVHDQAKRLICMYKIARTFGVMLSGHPFQKLCYTNSSSDLPEALLAASGPNICYHDLRRGTSAGWRVDYEDINGTSDGELPDDNGDGENERPAKRQRLSRNEEGLLSRQDSEESVEIISERVKGQRRKPKPVVKTKLPDVSHMLAMSDGRHVVVVTTDDKCIRVLERARSDRLRCISERSIMFFAHPPTCSNILSRRMPKRICAIALTKNETTIVAGDKFGDVYSLPLFPLEDDPQARANVNQQDPTLDFKPSASELTVHTKGNLEALRQQQLQKGFKPKKEGPTFEHKLLLGHVSLLTDLAIAEVEDNGGKRQFILTADRDEHIRVSRGVSQAHVIENYCLGHKDFVSKLCILPWQSNTLIAGSGEPSLKVYDWQRGLCLTDLIAIDGTFGEINHCINSSGQERPMNSLAVSGIWPISLDQRQGLILVALEGLPLLLSYVHNGQVFARMSSLQFAGNVLDVAVGEAGRFIVVSIDTVHQSGSMKSRRNELLSQEEAIVCFTRCDEPHTLASNIITAKQGEGRVQSLWTRSPLPSLDTALAGENLMAAIEPEEGQHKPHKRYSKLGEFLYGLENLRKQRGQEDPEANEEAGADENGAIYEEDANELSKTL